MEKEHTHLIGGYLRLSKEEDGRNSSIANQRLLITQYAAQNKMEISCWYEDNGISGYQFDRPGFSQLRMDLDQHLDTVIVKDFSRLGRHNAKVLLLVEEFQKRGKRLIVIDDNFDSLTDNDEILGIRTWYNERYIKDISKKIKSSLLARQKNGSLLQAVPFGYYRSPEDNAQIEVYSEAAAIIQNIFTLYLKGYGYRSLAGILNETNVPTPSLLQSQLFLDHNKISQRKIARSWSDSMVRDILNNDFYIGVYRLHKRSRSHVHGADSRVPPSQQFTFPNHHTAIIDEAIFQSVQAQKKQRIRSSYKGASKERPLFAGLVFCKDCLRPLTPVTRRINGCPTPCYVCSSYQTHGASLCTSPHLISEKTLLHHFHLLQASQSHRTESRSNQIQSLLLKEAQLKEQLETLILSRQTDLASQPEHSDLLIHTYDPLLRTLLIQFSETLEKKSALLEHPPTPTLSSQDELSRSIDKIMVAEDGTPVFHLLS
ncbi:MAG: recombinase family protein [Lachnospiraceae bacterium]